MNSILGRQKEERTAVRNVKYRTSFLQLYLSAMACNCFVIVHLFTCLSNPDKLTLPRTNLILLCITFSHTLFHQLDEFCYIVEFCFF